jgi:hypothetical protein
MKLANTLLLFLATPMFIACTQQPPHNNDEKNWVRPLYYSPDTKVLILYADDTGMCDEPSGATVDYLLKGKIHADSTAPANINIDEIVTWLRENPQQNVGLNLTLSLINQWQPHRWESTPPITIRIQDLSVSVDGSYSQPSFK